MLLDNVINQLNQYNKVILKDMESDVITLFHNASDVKTDGDLIFVECDFELEEDEDDDNEESVLAYTSTYEALTNSLLDNGFTEGDIVIFNSDE